MQAYRTEPLVFELGSLTTTGLRFPSLQSYKNLEKAIPECCLRTSPLNLPALSEPEAVRHYTRLSQMNICIDTALYPLGSFFKREQVHDHKQEAVR